MNEKRDKLRLTELGKAIRENNILTIFGQNILKARTARKLSQRAFSELCGISNGDISQIENGKVNITLNTVAQLANALEVPYHTLLKP